MDSCSRSSWPVLARQIGQRRICTGARSRGVSELLTVRDAADRLGVAYSTLKQWIYDGSIRTTKTRGGHHRIAPSEIDRILISQDKAPKASATKRAGVLVALSGRNQLQGIVEEVRGDG